jgi:hypothetical protein
VPDEVQAFSFNLFEVPQTAGAKFGIELIGAGAFDAEDADWACDEIWESKPRQLVIPISFSSTDWRKCLTSVRGLVDTVLSSQKESAVLKSRQAVAIGFVDGDLEVIWHA